MNPASAVKVLLWNSFLIEENQEYFSTQKLLKVTFSKNLYNIFITCNAVNDDVFRGVT